jgi:hypothetical protein
MEDKRFEAALQDEGVADSTQNDPSQGPRILSTISIGTIRNSNSNLLIQKWQEHVNIHCAIRICMWKVSWDVASDRPI